MTTEDLEGYESFGKAKPKPVATGEVEIPAIININADTGKIIIKDTKEKIKIEFIDIQKAKKWADAVR